MKSDILLLKLKRMRYKVKLASEDIREDSIDEGDVDVESEEGSEESLPSFGKKLNWTGPNLDYKEWDDQPPTKISVDPVKALERVRRFITSSDSNEIAGLTQEEIDAAVEKLMKEDMRSMRRNLDEYHMRRSEAGRGMIPGTGGIMTDKARREGLERLRMDRPELFDPKKIREMKDHQPSYNIYYDSFFPDYRRNNLNEMRATSMGYAPVKLEAELANQLSGLIGNHLVGKSFKISTGSPTLPKEETVTIQDVDPDKQMIIFKPIGRGLKLFSSYDDFFYNTSGRSGGKSDGERALLAVDPKIQMPSKSGGALSRGWKNLLKILPPWAKA